GDAPAEEGLAVIAGPRLPSRAGGPHSPRDGGRWHARLPGTGGRRGDASVGRRRLAAERWPRGTAARGSPGAGRAWHLLPLVDGGGGEVPHHVVVVLHRQGDLLQVVPALHLGPGRGRRVRRLLRVGGVTRRFGGRGRLDHEDRPGRCGGLREGF